MKVNREQAEKEVANWLEKKKVFSSTKEANRDSIELLIESICEGVLIYNEAENTFTHYLLFPPSDSVTTLTYKSRLNDNMLRPHLKGVAANDPDSRLAAYVAALTDTMKAVINGLDSQDKKISLAIAVFFI